MWNPRPSATSVTPISSRNASASILTDGCSWTNFDSGPDAMSMTPTAMRIAAIMIGISSTSPTAVRTESSENTMSSATIWASVPPNDAEPPDVGRMRLLALDRFEDLGACLPEQEQAADDQDDVAPRELEAPDRDHRGGQADDPRDGQEQQDPHARREAEADQPRTVALLGRQPLHEHGDEDHVVDAEHDLERRQREQGDPRLGVAQHVHRPSRVAGSARPFGVPWAPDDPGTTAQPRAPGARPAPGRAGRAACRAHVRRRRAARRVPPRRACPARVPPVDARLPDEPQRFRGDGRPPAGRGLRRGAVDGGGRPDRHQHLRDPRGRRAEGDRPPGPPGTAQGCEPRAPRGPHRLLGPRATSRRAQPPLPGGRPVPAPRRGA